jgi:hypothetical protein
MAAITGAVVGIGSAVMAKRSADKQTRAMREGNDAAVGEQRRQYDQTREDFSPWLAAGKNALNQLANPVENFYASPDYEFRRSEGLRDIGNQFAAKGGGGNAMKALAGYNSNLASGEFGNWFNRTFSQAEAGRGATGSVGQAGANAANNISAGYQNLGSNLATVQGNKYANINNAMVGGISNYLYAKKAGY